MTHLESAVEQLRVWSQRTKSEFFSADEKSDPAALSYQSILSAKKKTLIFY